MEYLPKSILIVFHNGSHYDHHSIITGLAKEFTVEFSCLVENMEKHELFCTNKTRNYDKKQKQKQNKKNKKNKKNKNK